jgi:hypothetical protein
MMMVVVMVDNVPTLAMDARHLGLRGGRGMRRSLHGLWRNGQHFRRGLHRRQRCGSKNHGGGNPESHHTLSLVLRSEHDLCPGSGQVRCFG